MDSNYTLTVKFAPPGTDYYNEDKKVMEKSTFGHVWLEARKPGESTPSMSAGWSTGKSKFANGTDNLERRDWYRYRGDDISSITVEISKEQYDRLQAYPTLAAAGQIKGFTPNYDLLTNSCIDFAAKGLSHVGLAEPDADGKWHMPHRQVDAFLFEIARHRAEGADLEVKHHGQTYKFKPNERDLKQINKQMDLSLNLGLDGLSNQPQYAQNQPTATFNDIPAPARKICEQCKTLLAEFDDEEGIRRSPEESNAISLAMGIRAYSDGLPEAHFMHIQEDGQINIGYESRQGKYLDTSIHTSEALSASMEELVGQSKQAEQHLALLEEQKALQIAEYRAQSNSRSYG